MKMNKERKKGQFLSKCKLYIIQRWETMPFIIVSLLFKNFDFKTLAKGVDTDKMPKRIGFRRLKLSKWDKTKGDYTYGSMKITVEQRYGVLQAIEQGDALFTPLRLYFGLRKIEVLLAKTLPIYLLIEHIRKDQEARAKRDSRIIIPLNEIQRSIGADKVSHGIFGLIDYIARRNIMTYDQVYKLPDNHLFAILKIEYDNAIMQRKYNEEIQKRHRR